MLIRKCKGLKLKDIRSDTEDEDNNNNNNNKTKTN